MVQMTHSPSTSILGLEFNAFLFASIADDEAESPLSVVSALARLNLDPWHEAAELTRLPRKTAAARLDSLLAGLPGAAPKLSVSERLVALLPPAPGLRIASAHSGSKQGAARLLDPKVIMVFYFLVAAVLVTAFDITGHPPAAHTNATPVGPTATQTRPPAGGVASR